MKRFFFFIAAAALLAGACAKTETQTLGEKAIVFQAHTGVPTKAIEGSVFPTTETFSTYAWAEGTVGEYFMQDVTVAYNTSENLWKAQGETFYWPKNSTVDFISYYPTGLSGITVEKDKITFTGIDVNALQGDIMYADKAAGFSDNADLVDDSISGYTGVPTIFRHALSKVKFIVELNYNHKEEADGTVTDWEVKVNSATVTGVYTTGSAVFKLASSPAVGVIPWEKPEGNVWTPDGTVTSVTGLSDTVIAPGTDYTAIDELFVLPQPLAAGRQKITVNLTIKTTRNNVPFLNETFDKTVDLYIGTLSAWEMNSVYTYRVKLSPTASSGNGGNPLDPSNPVDPNDPDLSDAVITFDPAVDGWENVGVEAVLNL